MNETSGLIYFSEGSPWPEGQAIETAELTGRLRNDNLDILLSVLTHRYGTSINPPTRRVRVDASRDPVANGGAAAHNEWGCRELWLNAGRFELSGTLLSSSQRAPLDVSDISGHEFIFDKLPEARSDVLDDRARFSVYCIGHDAVAHVWVRFDQATLPDRYIWADLSGRLMVGGDDEFRHGFYGRARVRSLARIVISNKYSDARAKRLLKELLVQAEQFSLSRDSHGRRNFVLASEG